MSLLPSLSPSSPIAHTDRVTGPALDADPFAPLVPLVWPALLPEHATVNTRANAAAIRVVALTREMKRVMPCTSDRNAWQPVTVTPLRGGTSAPTYWGKIGRRIRTTRNGPRSNSR